MATDRSEVFFKKRERVLTSLREKLDRETGRKIFLYKQGVFWTAYEQSALILSRHKPLKISIKFVKTVNQKVFSVVFPDATLKFFSDIFGPFVETGRLPLKHCPRNVYKDY